jgi:cell division protein FtsZ
MENIDSNINFDLPKNRCNVIKVIGVGGGGSNAINYMFDQGINGVDFVVTNTDSQALEKSPVPIKIQLGASLTEGLGAGANPEIGRKAAEESYNEIKTLIATNTKMVFITAGMGGGTGTGAAPIIAEMAKEMDILTVGIVTMPFQFEGKLRLDQAQKGLENLKNNVDSLIVINNNKLREVYGNLGFKAGFSKADEVLAKAARGIAEVITHHFTQNIDLKDAKTVLKDSGSAIMGSSSSSGNNRAQEAIVNALDSPLLNDNKINGCKNVLLLIVCGTDEITIDEIGEINEYIQEEAGNNTNIIMGVGEDLSLGDEIAVTIIATGFNNDQQQEIVNSEVKKIIHTLEEDQKLTHDLGNNKNGNYEIEKNIDNNDLSFQEKDNYKIDNEERESITKIENAKTETSEDIIKINLNESEEDEIHSDLNDNGDNNKESGEIEADNDFEKINLNESEEDEIHSDLNDNGDNNKESGEIEADNDFEKINLNESEEDEIHSDLNDNGDNNKESGEIEADNDFEKINLNESEENEIHLELNDDENKIENIDIELSNKTISFDEEDFSNIILDEENKKIKLEQDIRSIEIDYEVEENFKNDLFNKDITESLNDIELVDIIDFSKESESEPQISFDFEMSLDDINQKNKFELDDSNKEILSNINNSFENTIFEKSNEIDFEKKENNDLNNIEVDLKNEKSVENEQKDHLKTNPFESKIDKSLIKENEKRREQLKKFNYSFNSNLSKIEEIEKQPAYKRMGLEIENETNQNQSSQMTIDKDSNDEVQLRSNNSFLHDNVD